MNLWSEPYRNSARRLAGFLLLLLLRGKFGADGIPLLRGTRRASRKQNRPGKQTCGEKWQSHDRYSNALAVRLQNNRMRIVSRHYFNQSARGFMIATATKHIARNYIAIDVVFDTEEIIWVEKWR